MFYNISCKLLLILQLALMVSMAMDVSMFVLVATELDVIQQMVHVPVHLVTQDKTAKKVRLKFPIIKSGHLFWSGV